MLITALLSQYNFIGKLTGIPIYVKTLSSHKVSHTPCAIVLNSASRLRLDTTLCFLLLQVTKFPHIKVQYPDVDLVSVTEPAQSTLVNASIPPFSLFLKKSPFPGVLSDIEGFDIQLLGVLHMGSA